MSEPIEDGDEDDIDVIDVDGETEVIVEVVVVDVDDAVLASGSVGESVLTDSIVVDPFEKLRKAAETAMEQTIVRTKERTLLLLFGEGWDI